MCSSHIVFYFIYDFHYFRLPSYHINTVSLSFCVCVCVCVCVVYVCARTCASNFLLTCILILFNADVNWLPGTTSPYGYSRQLVL